MAKPKPITYRNVSDSDKTVFVGGRYQRVNVGEQITTSETGTYWQTGEQGEEALWEVVGGRSRNRTAQTDEPPVDEPPVDEPPVEVPVNATDDDKKES